jgi:hypothetical protein
MASALDTARAAIEGRIQTLWALSDNTTIAWPNQPTSPPATGTWIQPTILWGDGFIQTKNGRNTIAGLLNINVYGEPGKGWGPVSQTGDSVRDLVNRVEVSGVRFGAPSGPRPVPSPDLKWVQANVRIPFTVDEVVT